MTTFIDTSAIVALIDADQRQHDRAMDQLAAIGDAPLVTHASVVAETTAILDRRLGAQATGQFLDVLLPTIVIHTGSESMFQRALAGFRAGSGRRRPSLTDCLAFETMRELHLTDAFAFDDHFRHAGFTIVPD